MPQSLNPHPSARRASGRAARGLSLIEIAVVLAIAGILSAVAYPSYLDQVRRSRRTDAQAVLMQACEFLERFYTENLRYDQSIAGVAVALPTSLAASPRDGTTKYYAVSLEAVSSTTFLLRAVPQGAQSGDACDVLRINQLGVKTGSLTTCWLR